MLADYQVIIFQCFYNTIQIPIAISVAVEVEVVVAVQEAMVVLVMDPLNSTNFSYNSLLGNSLTLNPPVKAVHGTSDTNNTLASELSKNIEGLFLVGLQIFWSMGI